MTRTRTSRAVGIASGLLNLAVGVAVMFGAFLVVNAAVGMARDGHMLVGATLPAKLQFAPDRLLLPPGVSHHGWLTTTVQLQHPTPAQEALATALMLTQLVLLLAVLWLLRRIVLSVRRGEPFGSSTVASLRAIAGVLLIGGPVVEAINEGLRTSLFDRLPAAQQAGVGSAGYTIPGNLLVAGLGALVLAEVFAHGLQLREDVEATI
jgi:hypothetical protein